MRRAKGELVSGIFLAEPIEAGSLFTAVVYFGWSVPLLGRIFDWAVRTFLPHRLEALRRHMAEEEWKEKWIFQNPMTKFPNRFYVSRLLLE